MSAMEALRSSHRRTMTAILTGRPERLETGDGFDELTPSEDLVSVIVPSYTHEEFVGSAVRSVTGQPYRNIEVILIDDESPDRTFERALGVLRSSALPYCAIRRRNAGMNTNLHAGTLAAARTNRADIAVGPVDEALPSKRA
jgi:cellulose synthase/poly-beta-1,6-N-acetylglucosamine synthase-like glycosyltransferase